VCTQANYPLSRRSRTKHEFQIRNVHQVTIRKHCRICTNVQTHVTDIKTDHVLADSNTHGSNALSAILVVKNKTYHAGEHSRLCVILKTDLRPGISADSV
jgi:hypothetical protein